MNEQNQEAQESATPTDQEANPFATGDYSSFEKLANEELGRNRNSGQEDQPPAQGGGDSNAGDGGGSEDEAKASDSDGSGTDESKNTDSDGEDSGKKSQKPNKGKLPKGVQDRFNRLSKSNREKDDRIRELEAKLEGNNQGEPPKSAESNQASSQDAPNQDSAEDEFEPADYEYPPPESEFIRGDEDEATLKRNKELHEAATLEWVSTDRWKRGPYAKRKEANPEATPSEKQPSEDSVQGKQSVSDKGIAVGRALYSKIESLNNEDVEGFSESGDAFLDGVFGQGSDIIRMSPEMAGFILDMEDGEIRNVVRALNKSRWKGAMIVDESPADMKASLENLAQRSSPPSASQQAENRPPKKQPPTVGNHPTRGVGKSDSDDWFRTENYSEFEKKAKREGL